MGEGENQPSIHIFNSRRGKEVVTPTLLTLGQPCAPAPVHTSETPPADGRWFAGESSSTSGLVPPPPLSTVKSYRSL